MDYEFKTISRNSIPAALEKVQHYRYLNQAEEAESICRDVLAADLENQLGLRMLGLCITDQFTGGTLDRMRDAQACFEKLSSNYERSYYLGILYERHAKAQMSAGHHPHSMLASFEKAMECFAEAEKIRPQGNDDALLRWNRCVRLMQGMPEAGDQEEFELGDAPPILRE